MRWRKKKLTIGCKRQKNFFAFIPICINDEFRWLEFVEISQMYLGEMYPLNNGWVTTGYLN